MPEIPKRLRKRLGLPYQGSKRDIAFSIVCAIYQRHPNAEYFYDLFGGSGSTLIACEQIDRKCYTMEIDPQYADVIVRRWQNLTGEKAINEKTGKYFD
ncbi:MAG: hypothetical protein Q4E34_01105 [Synergistaceae bacterium]|nr:hypothetical protein [Synergistaceae bacterium]